MKGKSTRIEVIYLYFHGRAPSVREPKQSGKKKSMATFSCVAGKRKGWNPNSTNLYKRRV